MVSELISVGDYFFAGLIWITRVKIVIYSEKIEIDFSMKETIKETN